MEGEVCYVYDFTHYIDFAFDWRFTNLPLQQKLGLLPKWWSWLSTYNFDRLNAFRSNMRNLILSLAHQEV